MMLLFGFLSLVPAGIVIYVGQSIRRRQTREKADWQILILLLAALIVMMTSFVTADYQQSSSMIIMVLLPVMIGLIPIIFLHWRSTPTLRTWKIAAGFGVCLVVIALLVLRFVQLHRDTSMIWFLVLGGGLITVVWQIAPRGIVWRGLFASMVLVSMGVALFVPNAVLTTWPEPLRSLLEILAMMAGPMILVALAGYLTYEIATASQPYPRRKLAVQLGFMLAFIVMTAAQYREITILDIATDGLGAVAITMVMGLAGFAVVMLLGWLLERNRLLVAGGFGMAVLLFIGLFAGLTWPPRPDQVTDSRAQHIDAAIQHYFADTGQYPDDLLALTPRYLLTLPNSMIFREQTWCYESGDDYYRLGYVHRPTFGVPAEMMSVREMGTAGDLPGDTWDCDLQLDDYRSRYGISMSPPD